MFSKGTFYFVYGFTFDGTVESKLFYVSRCELDEDVGKGTVLGSVKVSRGLEKDIVRKTLLEGVEKIMTIMDLFLDEVPVFMTWDYNFTSHGRTFIGRV